MEENSIYRIGDLAKLKVSDNKYQVLENRLGKSLDKLYSYSRGISENTLNVEKHKLASVSKHKTMTHDISDYDMAREELNKLIIDVVDRMKYRNLVGKTVYIQTKLKV
ncbi:MAG: hypothetical protein DRP42_00880 [Tenericutes bacterium]|nr:MAG: hypothetical protein DRP42_00880 [Mycoplasmatota bacterium]